MKSQIVSKFDLGLLIAYNLIYFDRNISENKDGKKNEGSYLSFVTNSLIYFKAIFSGHALRDIGMMIRSAKCMSN